MQVLNHCQLRAIKTTRSNPSATKNQTWRFTNEKERNGEKSDNCDNSCSEPGAFSTRFSFPATAYRGTSTQCNRGGIGRLGRRIKRRERRPKFLHFAQRLRHEVLSAAETSKGEKLLHTVSRSECLEAFVQQHQRQLSFPRK